MTTNDTAENDIRVARGRTAAADEEPEPFAKHKHFAVCGTAVDMSKEFCRDKSKEESRAYDKRKTRNIAHNTGAALTFFIMLLLLRG